jgi:hypothetical protein
MDFDREAAKRAGYTDEEIDAFLKGQTQSAEPISAPVKPDTTATPSSGTFDRAGAKEAGYTDEEINAFLGVSAPDSSTGLVSSAITGAAYATPTGLKPIIAGAGNLAGQGLKAAAGRGLMTNIGDVAGIVSHGVPWGTVARGAMQTATANPAQTAQVLNKGMQVAKQIPGAIVDTGKALVKGAARVAGPAGMAYDAYNLAPTAQKAIQGDTGAMVDTAQGVGEMGIGYQAGKFLAKPNLVARSGDLLAKTTDMVRQLAANRVVQGAAKFGGALVGGLTTPGNVGQNYPFPQSGPMAGSEINPGTGRAWTKQELDAYRAQYGG